MKSAHLLSLVLFVSVVFMQHKALAQINISGTVQDAMSGRRLEHAVVIKDQGTWMDVTDEEGNFSFDVFELPVNIVVRLFGYQTKEITVNSTVPLDIYLTSEIFLLGEIDIAATASERVAGNARRSIWDYAWLDNQLLLCEYGTSLSRASMLLLDLHGDTIARAESPARPVKLLNDCASGAYLMSRDSLWEYYVQDGVLLHDIAESAALENRVLRYCVGQNETQIYFAVPSGQEWRTGEDVYAFKYKTNNHVMRYYAFDRATEKLRTLTQIEDVEVRKLKADEIAYGKGPQPVKSAGSAFSEAASQYFFWTIMCREIDAPMYHVRDSLYILDHTTGNIIVMDDSGKEERRIKIDYHLLPCYQRASLVSQQGDRLYAVFESGGMVSLAQIDLDNGRLKPGISIPHIFPEHITIHDNTIYYLSRDEKVREARVLNRLRM
jgi:hypothetical protein